ncbi:hypothetical protein HHI36_008206 [Cryptolaemus montrouzieri]|uniref:Uncharacterized protein n=1 Tax=Cryptolaemus montrouzieri TaxID=559131 RepID=A0ABD2MRV1_9CUCU
MNTCRKVIYRLMKEANKREFSIYGRSRRNHISVSESLRINNKLMKTLNKTDIPFSDIKLFSSDGYLYKIKDDSVKKKKFTRILEKHNFISGDTIWERTDHAKILFGMNGDQIVLFPDGTKISKTIQVLPDLKFFNKRDKDGWTVIINNYLYEHPVYYPVECNNQSKTTLVDLKDGIKPELSRRNCSVIFPNNTNLCFDSHHIDFTKLCPTCNAKCTCSIKIHVENRYEHE